jgi:predicted transcriptional regulator
MKDAAAKIAGEGWYNTAEAHKELARRIRSAIRRAVKAERERCRSAVDAEAVQAMIEKRFVNVNKLVAAINTPATKGNKRKGRR